MMVRKSQGYIERLLYVCVIAEQVVSVSTNCKLMSLNSNKTNWNKTKQNSLGKKGNANIEKIIKNLFCSRKNSQETQLNIAQLEKQFP